MGLSAARSCGAAALWALPDAKVLVALLKLLALTRLFQVERATPPEFLHVVAALATVAQLVEVMQPELQQ